MRSWLERLLIPRRSTFVTVSVEEHVALDSILRDLEADDARDEPTVEIDTRQLDASSQPS